MKAKKVELKVVKSKRGYSFKIGDAMDLFPDNDEGRNQAIQYLLTNLLNVEIEGGTEYKTVQ